MLEKMYKEFIDKKAKAASKEEVAKRFRARLEEDKAKIEALKK
jgi:hypothetical protein